MNDQTVINYLTYAIIHCDNIQIFDRIFSALKQREIDINTLRISNKNGDFDSIFNHACEHNHNLHVIKYLIEKQKMDSYIESLVNCLFIA